VDSPGERDPSPDEHRADEHWMTRAVALAAGARRRAAPNPHVGCVLVQDGAGVGEGATAPPGGAHAEAAALDAAGPAARGATAYVTLEPCAHHGRTPPCADALVAAGVARVVVALEDPDPAVAGRGIASLRAAGVRVAVGAGAPAVREQLAAYLHHRRTGRALCLVKTALSIDGRTAAVDGTSQWITGPAARADAHDLRADSQAVVVGPGTALADHPALTVRDAGPPVPASPPRRVLLDALGRVPAEGPLFDGSAPTVVCTTEGADPAVVAAWTAARATVEVVPAVAGKLDLAATLVRLGDLGVLQAMVEGGAALHGALLAAGLVDRLCVYVGATALGTGGKPGLDWPGPPTVAAAPRWHLRRATVLGDDVRLDYEPVVPSASAASSASGAG
jgi:diaminohydroxyphosphoribosylaminopyrimidine deaminase/5-amino-6-(5-phosphoribosylamino)uracil reductase